MSDRQESLADAAKRKAREGSFAAEAKRVSASDRAAEAEEDDIEDCGAYGYLRGVKDRAIHLEFRMRQRAWVAPGYAWLIKPIFNHEGVITLLYACGDRVTIRGRNLRPVYDRILRHQALWIAEQGMEWRGQGADSLTVIYDIDYDDSVPLRDA